MTLPTTLIEAEIAQARLLADELVEQLLNEDVLGISHSPLHPDAGQVDAIAKAKALFIGAACFRATVLSAALNGYPAARVALGELVNEVDEDKWPSELKVFAKACANPHHRWPGNPPGASRLAHLYSDIGTVMVILELTRRFPNIPTASDSGRRTCHCDIVAGALSKRRDRIGRGRMTRGQVKQVWKRYKRLAIDQIGDPKIVSAFNRLPR